MAAVSALKLRIEGMDCAACALKIENAMRRLPGVSNPSVNYGQGLLSLSLDEGRTSRATIMAWITALGYTPLGDATETARKSPVPASTGPWWATRKGRFVFGTGVLLVLAYAGSLMELGWSTWLYMVAAALGLLPIVRRALAGARMGTPFGIETLMSIATVGALAIGAAGEAAMVVFLFALGELLEGISAARARAGIEALMDLIPQTALRLSDGSAVEIISVEQLSVGDIVMVRAGDRVPSDGTVVEGSSEVSEAPVTGEAIPVAKQAGSVVYAGSINGNGELRVEISRTARDNTISRIIQLVEEAQASKAPTARFIDRFSHRYTPMAMAVSAFVVLVPPLIFAADWFTWIYRGLSVLLIACPCALVISTPAAIAAALASGARHGLLIKGGAALEALASVKTVVFDKTGTLTNGRPQITDIVAMEGSESELLAKAAAVESSSSHPLGVAIVAEAHKRELVLPRVFGGSVTAPGKAVKARLKSGFVSVGSPRHAAEQGGLSKETQNWLAALEAEGNTVVAVWEAKRLIGLMALRDDARAEAAEGINRLRALGIEPVMLTGDNARTAGAIASKLGLEFRAELLPHEKLDVISTYKASAPVAMVGDGINDAPALAASSVGIAMGDGTDVALETADAALLRSRVTSVAELISLSRATLTNIWQNVGLALGLKSIFLATSLTGATPLWMAILADTGATVLVTANALRLLRFKPSETSSG